MQNMVNDPNAIYNIFVWKYFSINNPAILYKLLLISCRGVVYCK
jgi:hypothetical protein